MILSEEVKQKLKNEFSSLKDDVKLVLFSKNDDLSKKLTAILTELSQLSEKITFQEKEGTKCLENPCISIETLEKDFGIRYMGLPSGGEFPTFITAIKMVSTNNYDISERIEEFVEEVDKPVDIKVFVTTSCGWCPPAILKAYSFALVNDYITATAIDCYNFPELANRYTVSSVPKTVINDSIEFVGVKDDNDYFGYIVKAIGEI